MENGKHSNDSYIIYSQANRGGSGFLKVGQLVNGTKTPSSTQVFSFLSKGPFPGVFCEPAWDPQDKASPPGSHTEREQAGAASGRGPHPEPAESRAPHSCTHLAPRPAGAPKGAPRPETSARGDARAAACVSSLRPLPRPPPPSRGALSPRSGRTPGRRQAQPSWGRSPRASAPGAGASSRGAQGARAHAHLPTLKQSPGSASVADRREGRAGGTRGGPGRPREHRPGRPGGNGRGAWPAARRVQTGPRQPKSGRLAPAPGAKADAGC